MTDGTRPLTHGTAVWFVAPAVVFLDLISKAWARSVPLAMPPETSLEQFVGFRLVENSGVSFNALDFGDGVGRIVPLGLTIVVTVVIALWMFRAQGELQRLFVGLIFAGGLSNIVDRLASGSVTDFIDYRWLGQSIVSGNVADISITIGAIGAFGSLFLAHIRPSSAHSNAAGNSE